eukprot:3881675-Rhodomonas_salina.2
MMTTMHGGGNGGFCTQVRGIEADVSISGVGQEVTVQDAIVAISLQDASFASENSVRCAGSDSPCHTLSFRRALPSRVFAFGEHWFSGGRSLPPPS